jgi:hypothetical protein
MRAANDRKLADGLQLRCGRTAVWDIRRRKSSRRARRAIGVSPRGRTYNPSVGRTERIHVSEIGLSSGTRNNFRATEQEIGAR